MINHINSYPLIYGILIPIVILQIAFFFMFRGKKNNKTKIDTLIKNLLNNGHKDNFLIQTLAVKYTKFYNFILNREPILLSVTSNELILGSDQLEIIYFNEVENILIPSAESESENITNMGNITFILKDKRKIKFIWNTQFPTKQFTIISSRHLGLILIDIWKNGSKNKERWPEIWKDDKNYKRSAFISKIIFYFTIAMLLIIIIRYISMQFANGS